MQEPNEVQNAEPVDSEAATVEQQPSSDELENRVQQLEAEAASARDQLLRATADLRNYKRRVDDERTQLIRNASAGLIMKLLPVLDDFDLAMQHVPDEIAGTQWFNGLQGVQRKLQTIMEGEGVRPIDALGKPFDPNVHDAVMHEDGGPENAGKVTADLRRGYTLHDKVIRPSMVKVGQE
jgi:molecular chaperone GrpE